jgi:hypothetical protein
MVALRDLIQNVLHRVELSLAGSKRKSADVGALWAYMMAGEPSSYRPAANVSQESTPIGACISGANALLCLWRIAEYAKLLARRSSGRLV